MEMSVKEYTMLLSLSLMKNAPKKYSHLASPELGLGDQREIYAPLEQLLVYRSLSPDMKSRWDDIPNLLTLRVGQMGDASLP